MSHSFLMKLLISHDTYYVRAKIKVELGPNVHPLPRCQFNIFQKVFAGCLITGREGSKTEKYFKNAKVCGARCFKQRYTSSAYVVMYTWQV